MLHIADIIVRPANRAFRALSDQRSAGAVAVHFWPEPANQLPDFAQDQPELIERQFPGLKVSAWRREQNSSETYGLGISRKGSMARRPTRTSRPRPRQQRTRRAAKAAKARSALRKTDSINNGARNAIARATIQKTDRTSVAVDMIPHYLLMSILGRRSSGLADTGLERREKTFGPAHARALDAVAMRFWQALFDRDHWQSGIERFTISPPTLHGHLQSGRQLRP